MAPNGLDALVVLGVLDVARAVGAPSRVNAMYGATGRHAGRRQLGRARSRTARSRSRRSGRSSPPLLDEAERRGCRGAAGRRGGRVASDADGVRAVLADGERLDGDLVVGADGVRSAVRQAIDPAAPRARYVGLTNFGGITRGTASRRPPPEAWHFVFGPARSSGPTRSRRRRRVVRQRAPARDQPRAAGRDDPGEWQPRLVELVAGDDGPGSRARRRWRPGAGRRQHLRPAARAHWTRERIVVVGDAAHAPSPSSGQGASMALEDAVVLATSVRDHARRRPTAPSAPTSRRVEPGSRHRQGGRAQQQRQDPRPAGAGAARDDAEPAVPLRGGRALDAGVHRAPARSRPDRHAQSLSPGPAVASERGGDPAAVGASRRSGWVAARAPRSPSGRRARRRRRGGRRWRRARAPGGRRPRPRRRPPGPAPPRRRGRPGCGRRAGGRGTPRRGRGCRRSRRRPCPAGTRAGRGGHVRGRRRPGSRPP